MTRARDEDAPVDERSVRHPFAESTRGDLLALVWERRPFLQRPFYRPGFLPWS